MLSIASTDFMRKFENYLMSLDYCGNEYGFKKIIVPSGHHDKTIKGLMFVNERG